MFQLDLEKAEEPEIKLPTSVGSLKKQESSRKTFTSALLTTPKPLTVWIATNCGKFLKRWEHQTTWPAPEKSVCRSRNNSENSTGNNRLVLKLGKEYIKAVYCHPAYLTTMQSTSCKMSGWMNYKLESTVGRYINNLRYADDVTLIAESEEELKSLLLRVDREDWKNWLKT